MSSGSGGGDTESIEVAGRICCCKVGEGPFPAKNQFTIIHRLRFNDFFSRHKVSRNFKSETSN